MVQTNSVNHKKILIICGPTASGKTELAVKCAVKLNSEVISADSMNVYTGLDVGTAKPTNLEMECVPHHLIDVCSPFETFSVGDYREKALPIVNRIIEDGKIPVICGGTGFYINSIIYKMSYGKVSADLITREKYFKFAEKFGNEYVYDILKEKDFKAAEKLHYNDLKRVIRALEIAENGNKKSEINDDKTPIYDYKAFMIDVPREILYKRIDERVDKMINNGLIEEVEGLISNGITDKNQCMQGIGYKEIYAYLIGNIDKETAIEQIKLNTRHYAKRQLTFFNRQIETIKLPFDTAEENAKRIMAYYD